MVGASVSIADMLHQEVAISLFPGWGSTQFEYKVCIIRSFPIIDVYLCIKCTIAVPVTSTPLARKLH